jgi:RNA polymerase sigma-70 factor (ECF subfamily)
VRIVGCHFEAEDILQNTLLQAYVKLSHFRGHSTLYTWLYRLAVNQTLTRLRQKKNILSLECASTRTSRELQDPAELPAERLERLEDCARIPDILAQLDEEHRVVLVLREMDQLDYAAIASILAINLGTVRSRLHRARSRLRELLSA